MGASSLLRQLWWRSEPARVKSFEHEVAAAGGVVGRMDAGYRTVPLDRIVGSLDRWRTLGADFLPLDTRQPTERHQRVAAAMRDGVALPPLELYAVSAAAPRAHETEYFVVDGHHRVAMARRLGQDFLDAHVVLYRVAGSLAEPGGAPGRDGNATDGTGANRR